MQLIAWVTSREHEPEQQPMLPLDSSNASTAVSLPASHLDMEQLCAGASSVSYVNCTKPPVELDTYQAKAFLALV